MGWGMGMSKSTRILILLGIDTAFFLLELIVGSAVHSLALVADSFHMLNDVLSLCVGFWAVKAANATTSSKSYTYGWQRAETLGALVNGVFLVALCLSIFLEAIQRFVEPQIVTNPRLVLIVGSFGLLSNILGLFLFHEHGHNHGESEHGHSHKEAEGLSAAEEGYGRGVFYDEDTHTNAVADEGGNIVDVLPQNAIGGWPKTTSNAENGTINPEPHPKTHSNGFNKSDEDTSTAAGTSSPLSMRKSTSNSSERRHRRRTSASRARLASADSIQIHPASFRKGIIDASDKLEDIESGTGTESEGEGAIEEEDQDQSEESPLLRHCKSPSTKRRTSVPKGHKASKSHSSWHVGHNHSKPKDASSKDGHSHGDLNMRGVFLHVLGDALGNIGVIASALFIWLTEYSWRYYSDPAISLVITVIILGSAVPLCRAAARILLQAVPAGLNVDEIKEDIQELPGIIGCHHLHIWQLSDTKLIASLHVQIEFDFKGEGSARYMQLAKAVRHCLHEYGIHSSTIQPEFCLDSEHNHVSGPGSVDDDHAGTPSGNGSGAKAVGKASSRPGSTKSTQDTCLLECGDECDDGKQCCAPTTTEAEDNHGHAH